ncbi:peptidoglycan bridge formation glycyltransferase FemA/FemB family protein [Anaerotalea alkaliphila]|uniref:Aminoacyltransferase n=1 Tax=Anaerotalea alkaliphila TaxID=2662126 RepID=A0A7X5KKU8_9FIRM|nr:peptidoglycan bridge formation glycyltransferase FemA/FemB family protein [Anaerotalea alkaliphila]NDL66151.1 aminoacyltransferase [Anaerotalea alkaliphila]
MMEFMENLDPVRFARFNETHPMGEALQSEEWGRLKSKGEWSHELVGMTRQGEMAAAAMLLRRKLPVPGKSILYSPRGFVLDYSDHGLVRNFTQAVRKYAQKTGAILVKIDPAVPYRQHDIDGNLVEGGLDNTPLVEFLKSLGYIHKGTKLDFDGVQPRFVFQLDIRKGKEELLASFHHKTRYNIKLAEKKGIEIHEGNREDLVEFERIMRVTGERDSFLTRPLWYFQDMYDILVPAGKMKLYMARYNIRKALKTLEEELEAMRRKTKVDPQALEKLEAQKAEVEAQLAQHPDGVVVSGTILLVNGKTAWYLYGASDNLYRNLMPNYLIQWKMIQDAMDLGCTLYDFRGISGDLDPNNHLYGLYRFKRGFNGEFVEYIGEFDLPVSKTWYRIWEIGVPMVQAGVRKLKRLGR